MKKALLILGGSYHDFEGFSDWFTDILSPEGWEIESTYDLNRLLTLERESIDLVASYTCFSSNPDLENQKGSGMMENEQVIALYDWIRSGGAFYSVHAATSIGKTNPLYATLQGGKFLRHPPALEFKVYPMYETHEITDGISAFSVYDELYIEEYDSNLDVLLVSILDDVAHPMLWSKHEGLGRVVHNALGHNVDVWNRPEYKELTLRSVQWLIAWIQ